MAAYVQKGKVYQGDIDVETSLHVPSYGDGTITLAGRLNFGRLNDIIISQTDTTVAPYTIEDVIWMDNRPGEYNVVMGFNALENVIPIAGLTGVLNIAIGKNALNANTSGRDNIAMGFSALAANTTGYQDIGIGNLALFSNTTGIFNVATGTGSLFALTAGDGNSAYGNGALQSITSGSRNSAFGLGAGTFCTSGDRNTFLGWQSGISAVGAGNERIAIGYEARSSADYFAQIGQSVLSPGLAAEMYFRTQKVSDETWVDAVNALAYIDATGNMQKATAFLIDTGTGKLTVPGLLDPTGLQLTVQAVNPGNPFTLWTDGITCYMGALDLGATSSWTMSVEDKIANALVIPATKILTTTGAADLQTIIGTLVDTDVLEVRPAGGVATYSPIVLPGGIRYTIRVATGYNVVLTGANCITLSNGVSGIIVIGFIIDSCTTVDSNGLGSGICMAHLGIVNNVIFSGITIYNATGSGVMMAYHQTVGGDTYTTPNTLPEFSNQIAFVDCTFNKATTDATEGGCIVLRGFNQTYIKDCYFNMQHIGGRGILLQNCFNIWIQGNFIENGSGTLNGEGVKVDRFGVPAPVYFNNGIVLRNRVRDCGQGIDIDDFDNCVALGNVCYNNTNEGLCLCGSGSTTVISNVCFNNDDGIAVEIGVTSFNLKNNVSFDNISNNYRIDPVAPPLDDSNSTAISNTALGADSVPYNNATSGLAATLVQTAIDELAISVTGYVYTDHVYVGKNFAGVSTGSIDRPFTTIQAAITHFGPPINAADFQRRICIEVLDSGVYIENLTVPCRAVTIKSQGLTVQGNVEMQISLEEEFGVPSATFRPCLTLMGHVDAEDTFNATRNGIIINGNYRTMVTPGNTGNIVHDTCFIGTLITGTTTSDDGIVNGGAPTTGTEYFYACDTQFAGNIEGRGFRLQKWVKTTVASPASAIVGRIVNLDKVWFQMNLTTTTIGHELGLTDVQFGYDAAPTIFTVNTAGQSIYVDSQTRKSITDWVIWAINTPTIALLENALGIYYSNTISGLVSTQVQGAIDELRGYFPTAGLSTDNAIARYNGANGKLQNSTVIIDDAGNMSGVVKLTMTGLIDPPTGIAFSPQAANPGGIYATNTVWVENVNGYLEYSANNVLLGPLLNTTNTVPRWDGTNTNKLKVTGVTISDTDAITGIASLRLTATATTISEFSTDNTMGVPAPADTKLSTQKAVYEFVTNYAGTYFNLTNEPTGMSSTDRTATTLACTSGANPVFTIQNPTPPNTFEYWIKGIKYTKTGAVNLALTTPVPEGLHYIYFNGSSLNESMTWGVDKLRDYAIVSVIYWDASNTIPIMLEDERHEFMQWETHYNLHNSQGTVYLGGLTLDSFNINEGAGPYVDSNAQFGIVTGDILDEDIQHTIPPRTSVYGYDVFYRTALGEWRRYALQGAPVVLDGVSGRIYYNPPAGGLTAVAGNNNFALAHILATNDYNTAQKVIAIMGEAEYTNITAAREGANDEINTLITVGLPLAECVFIGTVIFQTSSLYTNTWHARIRRTDTGADYVSWVERGINPSTTPGAHGNLSGLSNDDHIQYMLDPLVVPTDNAIARWDGITGRYIQDSLVTIADTTASFNFTIANEILNIKVNTNDVVKILRADDGYVALGYNSLANVNYVASVSGFGNIGVGPHSLASLTDATDCIGIGMGALLSLTTGIRNVGLGCGVLPLITTLGNNNTGLGHGAFPSLTSGSFDIAIGSGSGIFMTSGDHCIFIGRNSGPSIVGAANYRIGIGYNAQPTADYCFQLGDAGAGDHDAKLQFYSQTIGDQAWIAAGDYIAMIDASGNIHKTTYALDQSLSTTDSPQFADLYVTGKLTVDGLIDPTGMEFVPQTANPGIHPAHTIWIDRGAENIARLGAYPMLTCRSDIADGALLKWDGETGGFVKSSGLIEDASGIIHTAGFANRCQIAAPALNQGEFSIYVREDSNTLCCALPERTYSMKFDGSFNAQLFCDAWIISPAVTIKYMILHETVILSLPRVECVCNGARSDTIRLVGTLPEEIRPKDDSLCMARAFCKSADGSEKSFGVEVAVEGGSMRFSADAPMFGDEISGIKKQQINYSL